MGRIMRLLLVAVVVEPRLVATRTLSIRSAVDFHLQQAQIQPQLNLLASILAGDNPHRDALGVEIPTVQNACDVS